MENEIFIRHSRLTLTKKFLQFGEELFTEKQSVVIKSLIKYDGFWVSAKDITYNTKFNQKSISSIIKTINQKKPGLIVVDNGFVGEAFYRLSQKTLCSIMGI